MSMTGCDLKIQYCRDARLPTIKEIMSAVSTTWNVPHEWMTNHRRAPEYSTPRQIAMAISRRLTRRAYPEIGRRFNKDHTTALHAARKYEWLLDEIEKQIGLDAGAQAWSGAALTILRSQRQ